MPLLTIEEINAKDSSGNCALTYITLEGNNELILELFLKGADVFNIKGYNDMLKDYCSILKKKTDLINIVLGEMNKLVKNTSINHRDPNSKYQKLDKIRKIIDNAPRNELLYNMEYFENLVRENI